MASQLASLVVALEANTVKFETGFKQAVGTLQQSQREIQNVGNDLKTMQASLDKASESVSTLVSRATAIGAVFAGIKLAAQPLMEAAKNAVSMADEIGRMSEKTGISVEKLSLLSYAASQTDTTVQSLGDAMQKLGKLMFEANTGNDEAILKLKAIGATAQELKTMDVEGVLMRIADITQGLPDQAKAGFLENVKRGLGEILPLLNQGSDGIKQLTEEASRLKLGFSGDLAEQARKYNDNLKALEMGFQRLALSVAEKALPAVLEIQQAMIEGMADSGKYGALFGGIDAVLGKLEEYGVTGASALRTVNEAAYEHADVIKGLVKVYAGVKITGIVAEWAVSLRASAVAALEAVAAHRAKAAATLASAQAAATAAASEMALANARVAELRTATLAAQGAAQLAIATNGLIPAQQRAAAASAANAAAQTALAAAQRQANLVTTAGSAILAGLGGPLGLVITLLGTAATAWAVFGSSGKKAIEDEVIPTIDQLEARLRRLKTEMKFGSGDLGAARQRLEKEETKLSFMVQAGRSNSPQVLAEQRAIVERARKVVEELEAQSYKAAEAATVKTDKSSDAQRRLDALLKAMQKGKKDKKEAGDELEEWFTKRQVEIYKQASTALDSFIKQQYEAVISTGNLTNAEKSYFALINSKEWTNFGADLQKQITAQFEAANAAEKSAAAQKRLNDMMAETPTAKLDVAREKMAFLADAFEKGYINEEKYTEAAQAVLGITGQIIDKQKELNDLLANTPTAKLEVLREKMLMVAQAFEEGRITTEQYTEIAQTLLDLNGKTEKTNDLGKELGMTFSSAFEDAISGGKKLSDIVGGLEKDIMRLVTRQLVTQPLAKWFADSMGGTNMGDLGSKAGDWLSSLFSFANGGIMTNAGPLPLHSYASGGVADTPQLALFGETRRPEAYVPLPDGRSIPVKMSGSGGGSTVININVSGVANSDDLRRSAGQVASQAAVAISRARRNL